MFRTFGFDEFWFIFVAMRWTLALTAIAFVGGTIGGIIIALSRISSIPIIRYPSLAFIRVFQGTPLLMQIFLVFFGLKPARCEDRPMDRCFLSFYLTCQRVPWGNLARLYRSRAAWAIRGQLGTRRELSRSHDFGGPSAGSTYRCGSDRWFSGDASQGHIPRVDHRLHRNHTRRPSGKQYDLSAAYRIFDRRRAVLRTVLAAVPLCKAHGAASFPKPLQNNSGFNKGGSNYEISKDFVSDGSMHGIFDRRTCRERPDG